MINTIALLLILIPQLAHGAELSDPARWRIRFSDDMPRKPKPVDGAVWYFEFPVRHQGSVNYVTTPYRGPMTGSIHMTAEVRVLSGEPIFGPRFGGCPTLGSARPFFHTRGFWGEFERWWSNPVTLTLQEGVWAVDVPLEPDMWSSVYGKFGNRNQNTLRAFRRALKNVSQVGMTFGGGCFFGHGISTTKGEAAFILHDYEVTR